MMGVLIKGVEMPKNCKRCPLRYTNAGYTFCELTGENLAIEIDKRDDACPLVEIPTPHGRLGDLDKLEKQFKRAIGTYLPKDPTRHMSVADGGECRGWTQALMAVQEAKTVIEAEGETDGR